MLNLIFHGVEIAGIAYTIVLLHGVPSNLLAKLTTAVTEVTTTVTKTKAPAVVVAAPTPVVTPAAVVA